MLLCRLTAAVWTVTGVTVPSDSGSLDVSRLEPERSHSVWVPLEEGAGAVRLMVTVSGTTRVETASDLLSHQHDPPHTDTHIQQLVSTHIHLNRHRHTHRHTHTETHSHWHTQIG